MPERIETAVQTGVRRVRHMPLATEERAAAALRVAYKALKGTPTIALPKDAPEWAGVLYGRQQAIIELLRELLPQLRD